MIKMLTRNGRHRLLSTDIKFTKVDVKQKHEEKVTEVGNKKRKTKPLTNEDTKKPKREVKTEASHNNNNTDLQCHNPKANPNLLIGAHISAAGGLENAPINAAAIGAKSFALFLKSQRTWNSKPLTDDTAKAFKEQCKKYDYTPQCILPHGSYLLNCGSPKKDVLEKSRATLIDELQRCEKLGIQLYNFHPGSTCGEIDIKECLALISESINLAHSKTKTVITENMSCQGNTVGGKFEELKEIIDGVRDKTRVGVCFDTCHAFAAGYDISTSEAFDNVLKEFDNIIGLKYLKAIHLNDSKGKLGCHLDRHENIGKGNIGNKCFEFMMNDSRLFGIPMILETPCDDESVYEKEIKFLLSLDKGFSKLK